MPGQPRQLPRPPTTLAEQLAETKVAEEVAETMEVMVKSGTQKVGGEHVEEVADMAVDEALRLHQRHGMLRNSQSEYNS